MKTTILLTMIALFAIGALAQTPKAADPADVASLDAIMKAVYSSISGDAAKVRDWDRFRSLFHKDARLIPTGKNPTMGAVTANVFSPNHYIKSAEPYLAKEGFFEIETARRVETFGAITHVFSTYESRRAASDAKPFARGINSFQLLNDGNRWWVVTVFWQDESPELPIPKKYLKFKN